jgi:anhydro-N-acetylmuramic acid kinase
MMSGTSMDGVDLALIKTDGHDLVEPLKGGEYFYPYGDDVKDAVRASFGCEDILDARVVKARKLVTRYYNEALEAFFENTPYDRRDVDIIGAHGQTITHRPEKGFTLQIGDPQRWADVHDIDVVFDLRLNDMMHGGQGAPLIPIYHRAIMRRAAVSKTLAILNLGGVGNITYIPEGGDVEGLVAFDTGPANAYMDDLVLRRTGEVFDKDGQLAAKGQVHEAIVDEFLAHDFFTQKPPKSLDRGDFEFLVNRVEELSTEDALATLAACSVAGVINAVTHLPTVPAHVYICGGGAQNKWMMRELERQMRESYNASISPLNELGFDTDYIEAQGFAYMAVRSILGLSITFTGTTGVRTAVSGGKFYTPSITNGKIAQNA